MSDRYEDNLENFFRSRLNEESGSKDWNLPPEGLFDTAIEQIESEESPNKKNRDGFIIIGLFLAVLLSTGILMLNYTSNLNNRLSAYEQEIQTLNEKNTLLENQNVVYSSKLESLANSSSDRQIDDAATSTEEGVTQRVVAKAKPGGQSHSLFRKPTLQKASGKLIPTDGSISEHHSNGNVAFDSKDSQPSNVVWQKAANAHIEENHDANRNPSFLTLDEISTLAFEYPFTRARDLPKASFSLPITSTETPLAGLYTFVFKASYLQSAFEMKNIVGNDYSLTQYDQYYNGHDVGLFVERPLTNRLFLETGLKWSRINNHSLYESELLYDTDNEFIASDGRTVYRNQMDILSPVGSIGLDDIVEMNESLQDQEMMENKTHINLQHDYIGFSLGARYKALEFGKFSTHLGLATELNYLIRSSSTLNTSLYRQSDEMASYESVAETKQLDPLFFSLVGSAGIDYAVTDSWGLSLSGSYGRSLNSLKSTDAQDNSVTFINSRSLVLGLRYKF